MNRSYGRGGSSNDLRDQPGTRQFGGA